MKKLFLLLFLAISYNVMATESAPLNTADSILNEIVRIRMIQDSTYQQRINAATELKEKSSMMRNNSSEYSVLSKIEDNTDLHFFSDDWTLLALLAFIVSVVSMIYSKVTYDAQKTTESNTKNAPLSVQQNKLEDLPRHFYRNIVCTVAAIFRFLHQSNKSFGSRNYYPSEANILKLQTMPDDILLPIDRIEKSYSVMHELRLLFRNYNLEVKVAADHLSRKHISDDSLAYDFDNLLFKPFYLTRRAFEYEKMLFGVTAEQQKKNAAVRILKEHFKKLSDSTNFQNLMIEDFNGYLELMQKSGFAYIKEVIDNRSSIMRSLGELSSVTFTKDDVIAVIDDEQLKSFIKDICAVGNDENLFMELFKNYYIDKLKDTRVVLTEKRLFESLKSYFAVLAKDTWNLGEIFYYILSVDVAIECDRIGIVNYS